MELVSVLIINPENKFSRWIVGEQSLKTQLNEICQSEFNASFDDDIYTYAEASILNPKLSFEVLGGFGDNNALTDIDNPNSTWEYMINLQFADSVSNRYMITIKGGSGYQSYKLAYAAAIADLYSVASEINHGTFRVKFPITKQEVNTYVDQQ